MNDVHVNVAGSRSISLTPKLIRDIWLYY